MKVTLTESLVPEAMAMLEDNADEIFVAHDARPHNYMEKLEESNIFIVRVADRLAIDKRVMECRDLKVIGRTGIGYDSVDVEAATAAGIPVVVTPGANSRSVAEHVIALMMALSKNMTESDAEQRRGNWKIRDAGKTFEVYQKTCLVIGLGNIGSLIARMAKGLDMRVIGYDEFVSREVMAGIGAEKYEDKLEAIREADVVIVQLPLIEGVTNNTIDKAEFDAMKSTAVLINCSRGEIVNEPELCRMLKSGSLAGAGLDVFYNEPTRADDEILKCPNVIVSPHIAAQTREAVIRMHTMCVRGSLAVCEGRKWPYVADKKVYEHPKWKDAEWAEVQE